VDATAKKMAAVVDHLLGKHWDRRAGSFVEPQGTASEGPEKTEKEATCSCGSGIPIQEVLINGQEITLIALPLIFQQFREAGKTPAGGTVRELLETVRIYNPVPLGEEEAYMAALTQAYSAFCEKPEAAA
jgi:hypothetical protein